MYFIINFPSPINLNIMWNLGFILFLLFILQIFTGLFLSFNIEFNNIVLSKLLIINENKYGWLFIKIHISLGELIFLLLTLHVFKSLIFFTYPSILLWSSGFLIFSMFILSSFLGYSCAGGIMGFWGITIGSNISKTIMGEFISGSLFFSELIGINNLILFKFFTLHMTISYLILIIIFSHLYVLHSEGSSNLISSISFDINRFSTVRLLSDIDFLFITLTTYIIFISSDYLNNNGESFKLISGKVSKNLELYVYVRLLFLVLRIVSTKFIGILLSSFVLLLLFFSLLNLKDLFGFFGYNTIFIVFNLLFLLSYLIEISNYFFITYTVVNLILQFLILILLIKFLKTNNKV